MTFFSHSFVIYSLVLEIPFKILFFSTVTYGGIILKIKYLSADEFYRVVGMNDFRRPLHAGQVFNE